MPALTFHISGVSNLSLLRASLEKNLSHHGLRVTGLWPEETSNAYSIQWEASSLAAKYLDRFGDAARERVQNAICGMGGTPKEEAVRGLNPFTWIDGARKPGHARTR